MSQFCSLFVGHGAPTLAIELSPARDFLSALGQRIGSPEAIVCVSAHWATERPSVSGTERPETIHDFSGFAEELYRIQYRAHGTIGAARYVADRLRDADFDCEIDTRRGLDHGAWVPLSLMYPRAEIPVLQLSVQSRLGPAHHFAIGRALAPLRKKGILIVGSGSATHNLSAMRPTSITAPSFVTEFVDWLGAAIGDGRFEDLVNYRKLGPYAAYNHPSEEHFLPLLVAAGAAGMDARGRCLHSSYTYGVFEHGLLCVWRVKLSSGVLGNRVEIREL